ncbi:hypothetical protein SAMN04487866_1223 [Thermoactinomyces sp. DSM 45891]|uniref:hypothetical protein n=1 Tax=Thermoactinomyces sp. DSM 45891 TaxID=1761907 RepID=UPI000923D397|nr:hypothetical protein [Thermoactinomyces sp. DSM 45891]SFX74502.1 hypothetical protein SAMN04487866_1223 [Thermoactinomyces sp. DSM 45891]
METKPSCSTWNESEVTQNEIILGILGEGKETLYIPYKVWVDKIYAGDESTDFWSQCEAMLLTEVMKHLSKREEIHTFEEMKSALIRWNKPDSVERLSFITSDRFNELLDAKSKETVLLGLNIRLQKFLLG